MKIRWDLVISNLLGCITAWIIIGILEYCIGT